MSEIVNQPLTVLDPYAGAVGVEGRWDSVATISAGYRDAQSGRPVVSRDGRTHQPSPKTIAPARTPGHLSPEDH